MALQATLLKSVILSARSRVDCGKDKWALGWLGLEALYPKPFHSMPWLLLFIQWLLFLVDSVICIEENIPCFVLALWKHCVNTFIPLSQDISQILLHDFW